ncbi:MAG: hypothetical protein J2P47_04590 [Acetobacteraceae bacterium]|nr:hypothetical protein [Acetobacteraceae bacterium]
MDLGYRPDDAEELRFPPVMSRADLERSGYLQSFPNLLGCVAVLDGAEDQIRGSVARFETGGDWTDALAGADLVPSPAACHPVYPLAARRGPCPHGDWVFDVARLLPPRTLRLSRPPAIVPDAGIRADRDGGGRASLSQGVDGAGDLGLAARTSPPSHPIFGREGQIRASVIATISVRCGAFATKRRAGVHGLRCLRHRLALALFRAQGIELRR